MGSRFFGVDEDVNILWIIVDKWRSWSVTLAYQHVIHNMLTRIAFLECLRRRTVDLVLRDGTGRFLSLLS